MIVVSRSVHIRASVAKVFALMANPAARAHLNPAFKPIRVETGDGRPLGPGSVCHFRLQSDRRIIDYRTRVKVFEPDRLIVSVSDSAIPFEVRMEVAPEGDGARLTQTESFQPTDEMLRQADNGNSFWMAAACWFLDDEAALNWREQQERALTRKLEKVMASWLTAIKHHLERD